MKSIKAWGVGQLASGPLLTLTIIVINSDTQSSLFTAAARERGEISLFIGEGPFHKVQSFIIWAEGVAGMRLWGVWGAPQLKTHCDLVAGRTCRGRKFKQGEETAASSMVIKYQSHWQYQHEASFTQQPVHAPCCLMSQTASKSL